MDPFRSKAGLSRRKVMILRFVKYGVIGACGTALVGGLVFGSELMSYLGTSARSVRTAMKESVPVEFELARAKNMLDEIIPELQANVRLIAQEEVEVADLCREIQQAQGSLAEERTRVTKIRNVLNTQNVAYTFGGVEYSRQQI